MRTVLIAAALFAVHRPACGQPLRSVDFATPPAWTLTGSGTNSNTFGHQNTTFAGGFAGEGGGTFTRSNFDRIYADTSLGGALALAGPVSASGRLNVRNATSADLGYGLLMGHFNSGNHAGMGLFFNQDLTSTEGAYLDLVIRSDTATAKQVRLSTNPDPTVSRQWTYSWDPSGGVLGGGRITASVSGADGGTRFIDLTAAERAQMPGLNAFGFDAAATDALSGNPSQPTWSLQVYADNLSYSVVAEPAWTLAVTSVLLATLRFRRKPVEDTALSR